MKTLAVPLILALGGAVAAAPGIRPVPGGRTDRQMTAMAVSGQTHLVSREIQVDLEFQGGALGKGRLSILYDPISALYFDGLNWDQGRYPQDSFSDRLEGDTRVGIADDRMFLFTLADGILVTESTEKAASIDEAEDKSMKWYTDHLTQIQRHEYARQALSSAIPLFRADFPKGFFLSDIAATPMLPIKFVGLARQDDGWKFTLGSWRRTVQCGVPLL